MSQTASLQKMAGAAAWTQKFQQETYELMMKQLSTRLVTFTISFEKKIPRMWRNQTVQNVLARHTFIILQPYRQQNCSKKCRNHPFVSPDAVQWSAWVFKALDALPGKGAGCQHSLHFPAPGLTTEWTVAARWGRTITAIDSWNLASLASSTPEFRKNSECTFDLCGS